MTSPVRDALSALVITLVALVAMTSGDPALSQQVSPASSANEALKDAAGKDAPAKDAAYEILQDTGDRLLAQLPNGLVVIVQEIHSAPVVSAQVWVKTGSIYEQEHTGAGLSHFLEHLLSGGTTTTRSETENNRILGAIGARTNAATSLDNVSYYINTTSEFAPQAIDLLSDWMQNSVIDEEQYKRERDVIQREFAMGQGDPGRIFWKLTQQARFTAHPARHPTIGYLDEFLKISRDQIYAFYKRMYVPNNMVFTVAGDVDRKAVLEQIAKAWSGTARGKLPELSFPIEAEIDRPRTFSGHAGIQRPRLRMAWSGTQLGQEGDYALDVLAVILGQGESSRLSRQVRDEAGLVTSIAAYNLSFSWGKGFFGVESELATPRVTDFNDDAAAVFAKAIEQAKAAILAEVAAVRDQGVTDAELARAKRKTLASVIYAAQTAEGTASRLARDFIGTGDPDYLTRYAAAVESITAQEVQAAAQRFLDPQRLITVTLMPGGAQEQAAMQTRSPDEAGAEALERQAVDLDNSVLMAHWREAGKKPLERHPAGQIEPIQRFVLPNGLRVLVSRSTSIPAVAMQFYHLGGLLADEPGSEGIANAAAQMILKGTANRSAHEIETTIESLGAGLSADAGNNTWYSRAVSLSGDWKTVFEVQADVILNPNFPPQEWAKLQPRLLAAIDRTTDSWNGELRTNFLATYFGDHPWSRLPIGRREVVEKLTVEDLSRFHQQRLGAGNAVLAVFGDVDPQEVLALATKLYGSMPAQPMEAFTSPTPNPPAAPLAVQFTTSKPLAAAQIGYGPGLKRDSADYPAVQVMTKVLSSFPSGWLEEELRGRGPGLVYAVGAGAMTGVEPGYFAVLFNSQPGQVLEALTRARAQIERIKESLVEESDLNRAKAAVLADEFLEKQSLSDRAADAALNDLYGLGADEPTEFLQAVKKLTAEELRVIAQTYLRVPVTVVLTHEPLPAEALTPQ